MRIFRYRCRNSTKHIAGAAFHWPMLSFGVRGRSGIAIIFRGATKETPCA